MKCPPPSSAPALYRGYGETAQSRRILFITYNQQCNISPELVITGRQIADGGDTLIMLKCPEAQVRTLRLWTDCDIFAAWLLRAADTEAGSCKLSRPSLNPGPCLLPVARGTVIQLLLILRPDLGWLRKNTGHFHLSVSSLTLDLVYLFRRSEMYRHRLHIKS